MKTESQLQELPLNSLINQGQYARLAEFLLELQTAVEHSDRSNLKNLTATALQICMFCQQYQMEMEWHRKSDEQIQLRLSELDTQLETLLNLIAANEPKKDAQHPDISVSVTLLENRITNTTHPNLWQRIRDLFGFNPNPSNSERQMTKVVVNTSFPSGVEKGEHETYWEDPAKNLRSTLTTEADTLDPSTAPSFLVPDVIRNLESVKQAKIPTASFSDHERKDASTVANGINGQFQDKTPSFMIYYLGTFRVYQNEQLVQEWPSSKGKSIFKYLVAQRNQSVPKEVLMELFWPEAHPDAARNNLNVSIYGLRQALRSINPDYSHILFQEESYLLNPIMELWIDIEEFTKRIQIGRQKEIRGDIPSAVREYQAAEALYQGEFLAEDRYEDWLIPQRQSLQTEYIKLLDCLSQYYIDLKDFASCLAMCTKMLAIDPCREEAHKRLMRSYNCQGQPYLALRQFHMCEEALKTELDLGPSESTIKLYQQIRASNQTNG